MLNGEEGLRSSQETTQQVSGVHGEVQRCL